MTPPDLLGSLVCVYLLSCGRLERWRLDESVENSEGRGEEDFLESQLGSIGGALKLKLDLGPHAKYALVYKFYELILKSY